MIRGCRAACRPAGRPRRRRRIRRTSSSKCLPCRTSRTPAMPSRPSAPTMAWPCGSRISGLSTTSTTTRVTATPPRFGAASLSAGPVAEALAGQPLVRLDVTRPGRRDDVVRQGRRRVAGVPVPAGRAESSQSRTYCLSKLGCARAGCHPSAGQNRDESGVSTSSPSTSCPAASRPNSNFVSARMMPRSAASSAATRVDAEGQVAQPLRGLRARPPRPPPSKETFSSCSPSSAFVAGVKIGSGSRSPSTSPAGSGDAAHRAGRLVVEQARAGEVAAGDASTGTIVQPLAHHRAAAPLRREHRVVHAIRWFGDERRPAARTTTPSSR